MTNRTKILLEISTRTAHKYICYSYLGDRRGHDSMVVGFITTYAISTYHH